MKKLFVFVVIFLANYVFSVAFAQDTTSFKDTTKIIYPKIQQNAFIKGEKLTFEINYGFITAGEATMEIAPSTTIINGRECYEMSFNVNSSSSFDVVYQVRDRYKSFIDFEGIFPWKFEQHIREGNYQRDFEAIFDHENLKAKTYTGQTDPKKFEGEFDIPRFVHDALSAFYYARTLNYFQMSEGSVIKLQNFYKDKVYPLDVKYLGKETIEVPAGEFRCIKIEPLVQEGGLFKSEGSIVVWLTDDDRKIPVKVQTQVLIGSINAELKDYSGLAGPVTAKE